MLCNPSSLASRAISASGGVTSTLEKVLVNRINALIVVKLALLPNRCRHFSE